MSNKVVSSEQLLGLSFLEATLAGDAETRNLILEELGAESLINALTDLSLILAASVVPCHTGDEMSQDDDVLKEEISDVLLSVRESFLKHS